MPEPLYFQILHLWMHYGKLNCTDVPCNNSSINRHMRKLTHDRCPVHNMKCPSSHQIHRFYHPGICSLSLHKHREFREPCCNILWPLFRLSESDSGPRLPWSYHRYTSRPTSMLFQAYCWRMNHRSWQLLQNFCPFPRILLSLNHQMTQKQPYHIINLW